MFLVLVLLILNLGTVMPSEAAPGETLNVIKSDGSPDVVLIPGLSGCAYGFRQVVPLLEEAGLSWAIVEPLAIGGSPRPAEADYSLTAQADRVAVVLEQIGNGPVVVLGHGVSASIALRLALRHPELVQAVLSIEGAPHENAATPTVESSLKWAALVAKLGGSRFLRDRFKSDLEAASGDKSWVTGFTVRKYYTHANRDLSGTITALRAMARVKEPETLQDKLDRIACPVLLLKGGAPHEGNISPEEETILRNNLSRFEARTVPGSGHFIFEEQPVVVASALIGLTAIELVSNPQQGSKPCVQ